MGLEKRECIISRKSKKNIRRRWERAGDPPEWSRRHASLPRASAGNLVTASRSSARPQPTHRPEGGHRGRAAGLGRLPTWERGEREIGGGCANEERKNSVQRRKKSHGMILHNMHSLAQHIIFLRLVPHLVV